MLKNVDCSKKYIHLGDLGYGLKLIEVGSNNEMPYVEAMENYCDVDKIGNFGDLGHFVNDYTWHRDLNYGDHKYEIVVVLGTRKKVKNHLSGSQPLNNLYKMNVYGEHVGDTDLTIQNLRGSTKIGHRLLLERTTYGGVYNFIYNITLEKMKYDLSRGI